MGLFEKLFGQKQPVAPSLSPTEPPKKLPPKIKAWDNYGRMVEVSREKWRYLLPDNFKKVWNEPDPLAAMIASSLQDGFFEECVEPAKQLHRIDPQPRRGATLLGATFLQLKRFTEAEQVIREALQQYGEDGLLLTNLAKAFSGLGDNARADRALWRALEVDPNVDNGLLWYAARQRELGGKPAELEAFRRVAMLPASWRAQLWLARQALESKDVPAALALYRESLQRQNPVHTDALMQISGDLGNQGLLKEVIALCAPRFDAKEHGLTVGNNLIKAYVDQRDAPSARQVLEQLYAQQRPDWREHLLFWEKEIDKIDQGYGPVEKTGNIEIQFLTVDGPIWARSGTPFAQMLPAKPVDTTKIAFACGSAEMPPTGHGDKIVAQPTDAAGRLTRGLPMFLAERVHIKTPAVTMTIVPWMKSGGFVLAGGAWTPDALGPLAEKPDYTVFLHAIATQTPWRLQFTIVRLIDGKTMTQWEQPFDLDDPAPAISAITKRMMSEVRPLIEDGPPPLSDLLFPPTVAMLSGYIAGLEQALAVFCSALAPDTRPFLHGERSIFDHLIDLCRRETDNVTMRLLLLSTMERESRARPDIAREYRERIEKLQKEHPLRQPMRGVTEVAMTRLYSEVDSGPAPGPDPAELD